MELTNNIKTNWKPIIDQYLTNNLNNIESLIDYEYKNNIVFPKKEDIFKCFNFFNIEDTKVLILGQDPYHNYNEAMGLSFSVPTNVKTPSSLSNIFKELKNDLNIIRTNPDLTDWAQQGVLLLNTFLTVRLNSPLSHSDFGWEKLTDYLIEYLDKHNKDVIYVLMGNFARNKKRLIKNSKYVIETVHPSGLSANRGFFGSKIFSKINQILKSENKKLIKWGSDNKYE